MLQYFRVSPHVLKPIQHCFALLVSYFLMQAYQNERRRSRGGDCGGLRGRRAAGGHRNMAHRGYILLREFPTIICNNYIFMLRRKLSQIISNFKKYDQHKITPLFHIFVYYAFDCKMVLEIKTILKYLSLREIHHISALLTTFLHDACMMIF